MSQTPFIFASSNNDIVLGKAQTLPFPLPDDFELTTAQPRRFEVWCTDSHNFYVSDTIRVQITSSGISVSGSATISGNVSAGGGLSVSQSAVVSGSVTASEIISENYSSGALELTFTEIYNAVTAINDILLRLQALEAQVGTP